MSLENALKQFFEKTDFVRFDTFFTGFMLGVPKDCYTEEERKQACSLFREKTDKREIASYPTIRKWFGLGGKTKPDRMQIFEIAFALSLSAPDVNLILKEGMFEPGIRINDYREIIFWFGLLNHLSYEECCVMIEQFERHINSDLVIVQATNTAELLYAFENNKQLSKDDFMDWLDSIAGVFKGYGKTALNYMLKLKKLVVSYMRKEWKILLENTLASTDFETWKKKKRNHHKLSEGEQIRQYLYKEKSLSDERRKEILDMVSFVYFEEDNNVRVLAEIFPDTRISLLRDTLLRGMTQKHLSDLLNIAKQKEKDMELTRKRYELLDSMEKNPEAVKQLSQIEKNKREHKRRMVQVERADLLPFIQYVAVFRYLEEISACGKKYEAKKAKEQFVILADQILTACNMAVISEKYELDSLLLLGFQEDDCYLYEELTEQLVMMKMD